ncbi:uncharacterized protein LOC125242177 isoform X1 [Leguminivora glycinivorella]|uniref:uncharacterized protein LOC125242177 isoform X1 n=1 Tax=Leguminivora glycinivorella TaxID=1035111 RepID=UPI00200D9EAF|nr:uncharacterized protein LOC125242177 isoform X1 [Leguminivora glycinivorella]
MLSLSYTVFLLYLSSILVECSHPGSLSVRKLNRQLIARKRQNTLDLCQMFNVENEKAQSELLSHNRVKRAAPAVDPSDRVENIVDKLYDEPEDGKKVEYRKKNDTTTAKPEGAKSGRRFDFAPGALDVNILEEKADGREKLDGKTVPVPWHKYWKHGIIPYFIDSNTYDTFLAEKITKAFDNFEQSTCIRLQRLRERPTDKASLQDVQWLYITNPSGTRQCVHSNELKTISGVQWVVFGYDCMSEGQIMHEVMHILGFSHEHVREDRDQHISVMWDNIKPGYKKFFETRRRPAILSSLPYDYASVLHYPPRAFSKNGKYTLVAASGIDFGQRVGLSEVDIEKVSMIFGGECIDRNKHYLETTCPTVIASKQQKETKKATQKEIDDYFRDRLWPYGIVNYKLKDKIEFSIEERQNIEEVIKHIEKETCIEFRDMSKDDDVETTTVNDDVVLADDGNQVPIKKENIKTLQHQSVNTYQSSNSMESHSSVSAESVSSESSISEEKLKKLSLKDTTSTFINKPGFWANMTRKNDKTNNLESVGDKKSKKDDSKQNTKSEHKRTRRAAPPSPARRHADDLLVLTRSPEPGCRCPEPGRAGAQKELVITSDCFNSVNDLLHVFVHVLGLDHQHNSHDRDDFLAINWDNVTRGLGKELQTKLPPAASVGFAYDYQSVTHYPWLDISQGVTSIMYPIWNDGWAMGHWQGLSSIDVQKLNLLYFGQCQSRKKAMASLLRKV